MWKDPVLFESLKEHLIILRADVSNPLIIGHQRRALTTLDVATGLSGLLQMDHLRSHPPTGEALGESTEGFGRGQAGLSIHCRAIVSVGEGTERGPYRQCQGHRHVPDESSVRREVSRRSWNTDLCRMHHHGPHGVGRCPHPRHQVPLPSDLAPAVNRLETISSIQLRRTTLGGTHLLYHFPFQPFSSHANMGASLDLETCAISAYCEKQRKLHISKMRQNADSSPRARIMT